MATPTAEVPEPATAMQAENVDPDMHHRAFFWFQPTLFLADLGNIVSCCCCCTLSLHYVPLQYLTSTSVTHAGFGLQHIWHTSAGTVRGWHGRALNQMVSAEPKFLSSGVARQGCNAMPNIGNSCLANSPFAATVVQVQGYPGIPLVPTAS
jgi:hypothetical protein